jgi:signal transduction histidine kinase
MLDLFIISLQLIGVVGFFVLTLHLQHSLDGSFKVHIRTGLCGLSLLLAGLFAQLLDFTKIGIGSSSPTALLNGLGLVIFLYACWQLWVKTQLNHPAPPHLTTPLSSEEEMSRHLRAVMRLMDQGFVVWDKNDRIITCNKIFQKFLDYPDHLIQPGTHLSQLIRYQADLGRYGKGDREKQVKDRVKKIKGDWQSLDSVVMNQSGVSMILQRHAVPGYGDITTFTDITELRSKERELQKQEDLLQSAMDQMTNGLAIYDDQNKIITANQRFNDLFNFPAELVKTGVHLNDLLHFRSNRGDFGSLPIDDVIQEKSQILAGRQFHRAEEETIDGHWVEIFRSPAANNGNIIIINDITERRQTEIALERLNTEKDKLFTIIAHDLRGPFASLVGVTELLAKRSDNLPTSEISRLHHALHEAGQNLFELLENLLEWAQLQRDDTPFDLNVLDLEYLLNKNLTLYKNFALEKNIRLSAVNIPKNPILTDPNMIDTVLRNLLQNAIKFTSQGGGVIVSAHIDHEWMWVQITDTGIGISKERIKNIFKIDTTLSTLGTKGEVGSGLGLHVCNELVQKFGGKMEVISQEGNGATFKFSIPLA